MDIGDGDGSRAMDFRRGPGTEALLSLSRLAQGARADGHILDGEGLRIACAEPSGMGSRLRALCEVGAAIAGRGSGELASALGREAVREGGTAQQVGHVVGLVAMLGGMITFYETGRSALRAAYEELGQTVNRWPDRDEGLGSGISTVEQAQEYAVSYYGPGQVLDEFETLSRYAPRVFVGYMNLRQGVYEDGLRSGLSSYERELLVVAIECAARKRNPPPRWHAKRALETGATRTHLAQSIACALIVSGLASFVGCGEHALAVATEQDGSD